MAFDDGGFDELLLMAPAQLLCLEAARRTYAEVAPVCGHEDTRRIIVETWGHDLTEGQIDLAIAMCAE